MSDILHFTGVYCIKHYRANRLLSKQVKKNVITLEGKSYILDVVFDLATAPTHWYLGLIDNAGYSATANTDTAAKITNTTPNPPTTNGWAELSEYTSATRPECVFGDPTAVAPINISNSAAETEFTINDTKTVQGAFLINDSTKDGTTGKLWSAISFSSPVSVLTNDVIKVLYTLTVT